MTIEQLLHSKSKEEFAFIMFAHFNKPTSCLKCTCFRKDEYGSYKCLRPNLEDECKLEFYEWLETEI